MNIQIWLFQDFPNFRYDNNMHRLEDVSFIEAEAWSEARDIIKQLTVLNNEILFSP